MPLSPSKKKVTVQTTVRDEMHNIENRMFATTSTSPQHQNSFCSNHSSTNNSENGSPHHLGNSSNGYSSNGYNYNGHNSNGKMQGFEISQYSHSFDESDSESEATPQGPSNQNLLGTAFCTFMGFALVQTVVALSAGSEAMLGDSAAMIVDALTYLFNWYAEHKKATFETREWRENCPMPPGQDPDTRQRIIERTKRRNILEMELIPPLLSVSTLIVVIGFVLNQSIRVLILDRHRSVEFQGNPNIHIMMYFSIANLGLDLVNVANFAAAKHLFGFATAEGGPQQGHEALTTDGEDEESNSKSNVFSSKKRAPSHDDLDCDEDQGHANLNMCSAYTHVFADTLRSIAVLVAACLSELIEAITPEEADASAAVVVSGLILISLVPLFRGLIQSHRELRYIRAEEKNDYLILT